MTDEPQDPLGYRIEYRGEEFVLIRLSDQSEVGRFPTREDAVEAAEEG